MIVVDSNILAYLYLPGPFTAAAEAPMEHDPQWAAPVLWRSEFRNILTGYLRRGALDLDQACGLQREAESLLAETAFEVDSLSVFELVSQSDCAACDCEFVALARQLRTRLVTMDKKLLRAFPAHASALATA